MSNKVSVTALRDVNFTPVFKKGTTREFAPLEARVLVAMGYAKVAAKAKAKESA